MSVAERHVYADRRTNDVVIRDDRAPVKGLAFNVMLLPWRWLCTEVSLSADVQLLLFSCSFFCSFYVCPDGARFPYPDGARLLSCMGHGSRAVDIAPVDNPS